jgi:hypothetical protein
MGDQVHSIGRDFLQVSSQRRGVLGDAGTDRRIRKNAGFRLERPGQPAAKQNRLGAAEPEPMDVYDDGSQA